MFLISRQVSTPAVTQMLLDVENVTSVMESPYGFIFKQLPGKPHGHRLVGLIQKVSNEPKHTHEANYVAYLKVLSQVEEWQVQETDKEVKNCIKHRKIVSLIDGRRASKGADDTKLFIFENTWKNLSFADFSSACFMMQLHIFIVFMLPNWMFLWLLNVLSVSSNLEAFHGVYRQLQDI